MIKRYRNKAIAALWDFDNQIRIWTKIELLVVEGWYRNKFIPAPDFEKLQKLTPPSIADVTANEVIGRHQMIAFVEALGANAGPERKWLHFGLTSNDILDTTQNYLSKLSLAHLLTLLQTLIAALKTRAFDDKYVLMLGRTHGRAAEPITVGLFFARYAAEFQRHYQRLEGAQAEISKAKIAGATGTFTHLPFDIEKFVAQALGLEPAVLSTQLAPRDHLIVMFQAGINCAISLESLAINLRTGQRSEINEFQERFHEKQKGSSAMPHKINPITLENICALAKMLQGFTHPIYATNLLWNERDLTNSAIERVLVPDFFHLLATALQKMIDVVTNLKINYHQIQHHLTTANEIYSQTLLLKLLEKSHLDRTNAYQLVQDAIFQAQTRQTALSLILQTHPISKYLSSNDLKKCLDLNNLMPKINQIYHKIFADDEKI